MHDCEAGRPEHSGAPVSASRTVGQQLDGVKALHGRRSLGLAAQWVIEPVRSGAHRTDSPEVPCSMVEQVDSEKPHERKPQFYVGLRLRSREPLETEVLP